MKDFIYLYNMEDIKLSLPDNLKKKAFIHEYTNTNNDIKLNFNDLNNKNIDNINDNINNKNIKNLSDKDPGHSKR